MKETDSPGKTAAKTRRQKPSLNTNQGRPVPASDSECPRLRCCLGATSGEGWALAARQALGRARRGRVSCPLSGRKGSTGMEGSRLSYAQGAGMIGDTGHREEHEVTRDRWGGISGWALRLETALKWGGLPSSPESRQDWGRGCCKRPGGHGQGAWLCTGHSGSLCGIGRLGWAPSAG